MGEEELVTIAEAARRSGISQPTIRREAQHGRIPSERRGRAYLVWYPLPTDFVTRVRRHVRSRLRAKPRDEAPAARLPERERYLWDALKRRDSDVHELVIAVRNLSRGYAPVDGKTRAGT